MLYPNEKIEGKARLLEELDPKHAIQLDSTFTNHVANAIRASSSSERLQEIDKAIEAYENAVDKVLKKVLGAPRPPVFRSSLATPRSRPEGI
jgi:hypothetical protein